MRLLISSIVLAPLLCLAQGNFQLQQQIASDGVTVAAGCGGGTCSTLSLGDLSGSFDGNNYMGEGGFWFFAGSNYNSGASTTINCVSNLMQRVGTGGSGNVWVTICNDSSGSPGTVMACGTSDKIKCSQIPTTLTWTNFTGMNATIGSSTKFWIVITTDAFDSSNTAKWEWANNGTGQAKGSVDGSSWTYLGNVHYFWQGMK